MATLRPDQIIVDPDTALSIPGVDEAAFAAGVARGNPFAYGPLFAARTRRGFAADDLANATARNNVLRTALAQRLGTQDTQIEALKQLDKLAGVVGPTGAASFAGVPDVTGFAGELDPVALFGARAGAQKTASEAAQHGAEAGQLPLQSETDQAVTGFRVREQEPLDLATAGVRAKTPMLRYYDPSTSMWIDIPIGFDQLPQNVLQMINRAASGAATGAPVQPSDPKQLAAYNKLKRLTEDRGFKYVEQPKTVQRGGQTAYMFHLERPDGTRFFGYALPGDDNFRIEEDTGQQ